MELTNKTDLELDLGDLLERERWTVELRGMEIPIEVVNPLDDWTVEVSWKRGRHHFIGHCRHDRKRIEIKLNKNSTYPLIHGFPIGTERVGPAAYRYVFEEVAFGDANELVRYIFCHEFSHLLDRLQGFRLRMKQTKANRFALRHYLDGGKC